MKNEIGALKLEVEKWEKRLKVAKEADEKSFATKKLNLAKSAVAEAEKKDKSADGSKKKTKVVPSSKGFVVKVKKAKVAKSTKTVVHDGKTYTEKDKEFCQILLKKFAERRAQMEKANKKHKTVSVSSKISRGVAHAIEVAIDNVSDKKIKASPTAFINKIEKLEEAGITFLNACKSILGDDFNKADIKAEFAAITEMVDKIKSKYKK